jgi:protoporphyrinogen/coproporphyrinogen III oxidase
MARATVVGAGFTGLTAAYFLMRSGFQVEIIERASRAGGLINTAATPWGLAETAANGILYSSLLGELAQEIGVELLPVNPLARRRYVFRKIPRQWPLGPFETLGAMKRFLRERQRAPRPEETIWAWGLRVLGPSATEYLLAPALQGIYAGDPKRMSANLILARFFDKKTHKQKRARLKGTVAPKGGMGEFIQKLREYLHLKGVVFRFDEAWTGDGDDLAHPHILCVPMKEAGRLSGVKFFETAETLPLISATVFYEREPACLKGFGCLFPQDSGIRALGVLFNDQIFSGRSDYRSETWIMGGASDKLVASMREDETLALIAQCREKLVGYRSTPIGFFIQKWSEALPHYTIELERFLNESWQGSLKAELERKNIYLAGNYLGSIGLNRILESVNGLTATIFTKGAG